MGSKQPNRTEFSKYTKFFTIRLVQAAVQSRLGDRQRTNCGVQAERSDWFNLKIEEYGEVTNEIYRTTEGQFPPEIPCVSIDFQLLTCDGEKLPLESWVLRFDGSQIDEAVGIRTHFYHQLGTLLKSVVASSRATPSYRNYVRRQGPDSFIICYRIYRGEPSLSDLGEGHRSVRLGHLVSPFGSLYLDLYYRTNMVISNGGTAVAQSVDSSLKENYFGTPPGTRERAVSAPSKPTGQSHVYTPVPAYGQFDAAPGMQSSPPESIFSTFSTSPASMDFPWGGAGGPGESPARRPSVVGFQTGQTSESSSEGSSTWPSNRFGSTGGGKSSSDGSYPRRNNSSGTLFKMEISEGSMEAKPSSLPERGNHIMQAPEKNTTEASFPFSALLTASSAPTVTRAVTDSQLDKLTNSSLKDLRLTPSPDKRLTAKISSLSASPSPASGCALSSAVKEETRSDQEDDNDDDVDSSDDSFIKIDIRPFYSSGTSDVDAVLWEFKNAPKQLHSFETACGEGGSKEELGAPAEGSGGVVGPEEGREHGLSLEGLTLDLKRFEAQSGGFDSFVSAFGVQMSEED